MARVTIGDVAREAGVALGTVSNALNHPQKVRPETLKLVQEAIERLGYAPNQSARMLAGGHNPTFGLVLPRLNHGLGIQIASGAGVEARRNGYGLLIASANDIPEDEERYAQYFAGTQVCGIMIQPITQPECPRITGPGGIPLVYLGTTGAEPGHFVATDAQAQGKLIARHAIDVGARRVALVGSSTSTVCAQRTLGIIEALQGQIDLSYYTLEDADPTSVRDGYRIGIQLAQMPPEQRGNFVIALTDALAAGILAAFNEQRLSVPEDVAVAGCDGNPLAWGAPQRLTTCAPGGYEVGRRGIRLLLGMLQDKERISTGCCELVRPFLLARESTQGTQRHQSFDPSSLDLGTFL